MPIDEIKLGQVVYRLPCEGFGHLKPKSLSINDEGKVHEREDIGEGQESQPKD
jgi:hypothetical protein